MIGVTYKAPLPIGTERSGCQLCGEVFARPVLFDEHRNGTTCKNPRKIGLVLVEAGYWDTEDHAERMGALTAAAARSRGAE